MKIATPLHTDHQLDQLAGQFEHWRQTRSHRGERIPQPCIVKISRCINLQQITNSPQAHDTCNSNGNERGSNR